MYITFVIKMSPNSKFLFQDLIKDLQHLESQMWLPIYLNESDQSQKLCINAVLVDDSIVTDQLEQYEWHGLDRLSPGIVLGCNDDRNYYRWGIETLITPIVINRHYNTLYPEEREILEEFRLFFNLYFDAKSKRYVAINDNSDLDPVVKVESNRIEIKTRYLREFAALKGASIVILIDHFRYSAFSLEELGVAEHDQIEVRDDVQHYAINFQKSSFFNDPAKAVNSRLLGKRIISGFKDYKPEFWTDELHSKQYQQFIIGVNESGKPVEFSADPEQLANSFGGNKGKPHFLTPVFFDRGVLGKYYANTSKYEILDGSLECKGSWSLRLDNDHDEYVIAYLGDLGRSLSFEELCYWKSFNVEPDGEGSETRLKRDFLVEWANPQSADLLFKSAYIGFNVEWKSKYGFSFFKDPIKEDQHCFETIRVPLTNETSEFDNLTLALTKLMIDFMNEKELFSELPAAQLKDKPGGISKLAVYFEHHHFDRREDVVGFLQALQTLRSSGVAHRKSASNRSYRKAIERFGLDKRTYQAVFRDILNEARQCLEAMKTTFLNK